MNTARKQGACGGSCGCGGGCGGACEACCESRCCELECLERPNFYCGQLLTDADLAALVDWTRSRLALARYRDGWGIVCGLDLSCSAPDEASSCCGDKSTPADGPVVYLNSGYALDCCGNDLVVCEPIKVDLSCVCRPPVDPCDPHAPPPRAGERDERNVDERERERDCLRIPPEELFAVQLSLRYHEDLAQGQRPLFRGPCADDPPCQYARVLERPCVHVEEVPLRPERGSLSFEERWLRDFQRALARQIAIIRAAILKGSDAVLQHLRQHPPHRLCYLEEAVCCLRRREVRDEREGGERAFPSRQWLEIAKLMLLDWILHYLACPCPSCLPDDGVPLGRVILRRRVVDGKTRCTVVMIDQDPAYRRALRKDPCRPSFATGRDLGAYLWQSAERLKELGVQGLKMNIVDLEAANARELDEMLDSLANSVVTVDPASGGALDVHLVQDIEGQQRIAFFVAR